MGKLRHRVAERPEGLPELQGGARRHFQAEGGISPIWLTTTQYNLEHFARGHLPNPEGAWPLGGGREEGSQ